MKITKNSFIELNGRERAYAVLDKGTFRELLGPFDRMKSPHLEPQGIVPENDDGIIVARGTIDGESAVVISIEGCFQGGGIGEVSGAKIAGAFELALRDNENGTKTRPVLLFNTGGVRLQEANYGLLSIAEICAAVVALRQYVPVVGVIPGMIGSFGGMSITAGLFSTLIITREGRLGLNGPEVIEQEAGVEEFDSRDRKLIYQTIGGTQRHAAGFVDVLAEDESDEITQAVQAAFERGLQAAPRSSQVNRYLKLLKAVNPSKPFGPEDLRALWKKAEGSNAEIDAHQSTSATSTEANHTSKNRGRKWFEALTGIANPTKSDVPSVLSADGTLGNERVRYIAVVPNPKNRFPRARGGEVGLEEGWSIAKFVRDAIEEDHDGSRRAIVAIVDTPSQAYGYKEELLGIHQSCAGAADAYAAARLAGHPVIALIVGNAISGAFLSHGLQSNRILALNDEGVNVQAMSKESAARVTRRTIDELEEATKKVPAMAYDIRSFATLGALHELIDGVNADDPREKDIKVIVDKLLGAIADTRSGSNDLQNRLTSYEACHGGRLASIDVREKLKDQWN
ncbi:malonate decarboxylase beta subunit [Scopulibacillus darangshiensis]|uniref:Malonate decarboxylase beta subunit n=1 Tax=Scopulibacillus darangshiensis TaxID=442528 RepID=A0A4R2P7J8_9BACL|nr:biotin-independent malonate decarboxylase subunit beta [Scopulibacillus darangshiensis]TCP30873.1 malonate decarboxylase beta subunit [Scopulibacillus darangshiensis]